MREEYKTLENALISTEEARDFIAQNRGYDKEQARESYDSVVAEELAPAMTKALELLIGDLETRDVERLGKYLLKVALKNGG